METFKGAQFFPPLEVETNSSKAQKGGILGDEQGPLFGLDRANISADFRLMITRGSIDITPPLLKNTLALIF